jgi:hypothetical protein
MTERMRRLAPVLGTLVAAGMLALLMPAWWMRGVVFVGTVVAVAVLARAPTDRDDRWYGG